MMFETGTIFDGKALHFSNPRFMRGEGKAQSWQPFPSLQLGGVTTTLPLVFNVQCSSNRQKELKMSIIFQRKELLYCGKKERRGRQDAQLCNGCLS